MVNFGKKLKERQIQEWQGYYINYKLMKKKVKQYAHQIQIGSIERRHVLKDFSRMLDNQIEKIVLFLLQQQGLLASRIVKLGEQQDSLQQQPDISKISELREAYRAVGRDLLKLLVFVEMNAIGLRKILKKFDKRFGYRFTDYYVKTRANHPYSQLQQVFKHVGLGAVVGAVSRNLADLQDRQGSYLSIYDQPALPLQDPVIESIKAAVDRLTCSTNFLHFLAQHALTMPEELPTPTEEYADDQSCLPIKYGIDGLDGGSPLLFTLQPNIKSSCQVIHDFLSSDVMHGEGNVLAHLVIVRYKVSYLQSPFNEYDFRVKELFEDLQDGVRLCRAIQLLQHDASILMKMLVPSDTRKKNVVNCGVALQHLKQAGVPLFDEDGSMIVAEDIVSGDKELTLSLLWNIFVHLQLPLLINKTLMLEEISRIQGVNEVCFNLDSCFILIAAVDCVHGPHNPIMRPLNRFWFSELPQILDYIWSY